MRWVLVYFFMVFTNSLVLTTSLGCDHTSWQFYVSLACMMLAYVSGRYNEKLIQKYTEKENKKNEVEH